MKPSIPQPAGPGAQRRTSHTRVRSLRLLALLTVLAMAMSFPLRAHAAGGNLDTTFGNGGKVTTNFSGNSADVANAMVLQPDGKIVAVGQSNANNPNFDAALARYNTDGSLDSTFGNGGKVTTSLGPNGTEILAAALQSDGKIVIAGVAGDANNNNVVALARYNTNGTLDSGFGTGGKVTTAFGGNAQANGVAVQADGKIVVVGFDNNNLLVARYNTDGSPDTTFGSGGETSFFFSSSGALDNASAVAIQSDGKIVVAGNTVGGDFALARFNTNGSLDSSFGNGGKVTTPFSGNAQAKAVVIQSDGKIVAAGFTGSPSVFALARYNTDGSLDAGFGNGGKVTTPFSSGGDQAFGVAIQPDGKIVAAGVSGANNNDFALARYNTDGSLDAGFGNGGKVTTDIGSNSDDFGNAVAIGSGKIVVVGSSEAQGGTEDFAVARYDTGVVSDLTITKTHTGDFHQGQTGAQYTITVSNGGTGATAGTVTVQDTLPSGLTATSLSGTGWSCNVGTLTCTRSDALAASSSYPALTLTVDVAANAPASVTNQATVSGGGETNTANDTASDPTTIGVNSGPPGPPTATPELSSGELVATSVVPLALLAFYRRRRARRAKGRR